MQKKISKTPLYVAGLTTLVMVVLVAWVALNWKKEEPSKLSDFRTFDRPIVASAPGCEIRSPKGELMNEIFKDAKPNTLTLEKGTSFTIDCFPIQQSEKSTTIGNRE